MVVSTTSSFLRRAICAAQKNLLQRSMHIPLTLEHILLLFALRPFIGIARRRLALDDRVPDLRKLAIERDEFFLRIGHVVLGEDRFHRTLGYAQRAVDAFVRVDDQHVRPLAKAVDRADVDAVGVLALDAALVAEVSHAKSIVYPPPIPRSAPDA